MKGAQFCNGSYIFFLPKVVHKKLKGLGLAAEPPYIKLC